MTVTHTSDSSGVPAIWPAERIRPDWVTPEEWASIGDLVDVAFWHLMLEESLSRSAGLVALLCREIQSRLRMASLLDVAGLVEFYCGWEIEIGVSEPGQVSMVFQFDPQRRAPDGGLKALRISTDEAAQLGSVLADAIEKSSSST